MLSISPIASASYYLEMAHGDYYTLGGEPPGMWFGKGCNFRSVREGQTVSRDALRALLAGRNPDSTLDSLVQQQRSKSRQQGWDLTFSPPKSVSLVWAMSDPEVRQKIQQAHLEAVQTALEYVESHILYTRRGHGGTDIEQLPGGVFALFEHGTSRARDPQLHTHVLLPNLGRRQDGTSGTLISHYLYINKMATGALYRSQLAYELQQLGYQIARQETSFRVKGVPEAACQFFSKRARQINQLASEYGWESPRLKAILAESTREVKGHINRQEAFSLWAQQGREVGFSPERASLINQACLKRQGRVLTPRQLSDQAQAVIHDALELLDEKEAYFRERDVIRALAEASQGSGLHAKDVQDLKVSVLDELKEIPDPSSRLKYYATARMYELEQETLEGAERLYQNDQSHRVDSRYVEEAIKEVNQQLTKQKGSEAALSREQIQALYHVVERPSQLAVVQGLAGTGKTALLSAAHLAWKKAGYRVIGCTIAGKASLELQDATGIKSRTVFKTLKLLGRGLGTEVADAGIGMAKTAYKQAKYPDKKIKVPGPERLRLTKKTIVVLDEASMVNTEDWASLQKHVEKKGAKLVAVGDRNQVQSIGAGSPFNSLSNSEKAVQLTDILRQKHPWMREALQDIANGDVEQAIERYAAKGCFTVQKDKKYAIANLVLDWSAERPKKLSDIIVMTSTNEEAREVNQQIQKMRSTNGELSRGGLTNEIGQKLKTHDRVLFTYNHKGLGVANGDLGTIINVERPRGVVGPGKVHVLLDRKQEVGLFPTRNGPKLPLVNVPKIVTVDLKHYPHLELGYALTTHKQQGGTVEKALVLGSANMQSREQTYTQLSRVRDEVQFYLTEAEAGESLKEFMEQSKVSRPKDLAHDLEHEHEQREVREQEERLQQREKEESLRRSQGPQLHL